MRDLDWKIIATLYTSKSISKTSNLLFLTQPTLSKRLQLIEQELNTKLLIRTSKGVTFTPEGEYVARQARHILDILEDVQRTLSDASSGQTGTISIGAPNSYTRFVLPSLIRHYAQSYPKIRLMITTALSNQVIRLVQDHSVQLGFVRGNVPADLEKLLLSEDSIYIVSSGPVKLEQLPDLPQIDYVKEPSIIQATTAWWNQHFDRRPNIRMKVNHGDTCLAMIRQGLGYGIISDSRFFQDDPDLTAIPMFFRDHAPLTRKTWLCWHPQQQQNRLVADFIEFVKSVNIGDL